MKSKCYHSKRGFTLVELLITITIISVLTTVSVVGYVSFINKANEARDQAMVDQLNRLKQAYEVENGKTLTNEDLSEILTDNGISFNDASPTSDGQKLYYDHESNAFVLGDADNPEGKDHLTEINEEFLSGNTTTPSEGEEGTPQEPADEPVENTVTFTLEDQVYSFNAQEYNVHKGIYAKSENSMIKVGFYYEDTGYIKQNYPKIDLNKFVKASDNSGDLQISYVIEEINVFTYFDQESLDSYAQNRSEVIFNKAGTYKLTCTAGDSNYTTYIHVFNVYYESKAKIEFGSCNVSVSLNNGEYQVKLDKWSSITILDYQLESAQSGQIKKTISDEKSLMKKLTLVIEQDEKTIEIPMERQKNTYPIGDEISAGDCTIKLKYLGANGEIVYSDPKTVTISEK